MGLGKWEEAPIPPRFGLLCQSVSNEAVDGDLGALLVKELKDLFPYAPTA